MSEITKEEIAALVESNTKVSNALQLITDRLEVCSGLMNKVQDQLSSRTPFFHEIDDMSKIVKSVKEDTFWIKIIFGSITFITAISMVMVSIFKHLHP